MVNNISKDQILDFITDFLYHQNNDVTAEKLIIQFRTGYCYHFACILRDTFHRGLVCWAAPFGHIVWKDIDGSIYDIEGEYNGEAFYFIPVWYLGEYIREFMHINLDNHPASTKQELIDIIKKFCNDTGEEYNKNIENHFSY